jgi:hypothetical protein
VQVEGAASRQREQFRAEELPIVEAEQEIRRTCGHLRYDSGSVRVGRGDGRHAMVARHVAHALEPERLPGIVIVGHHEAHVDAVRKKHAQAAGADVVIGEDDRYRSRPTFVLRTPVFALGAARRAHGPARAIVGAEDASRSSTAWIV